MRVETVEKSHGYTTNVYYVDITDGMRDKALDFATKIIRSGNQYSRLLPIEVWESKDIDKQQRLEIQRTYAGKLAELAFADLLKRKGKLVDDTDMFVIYEGQENVDSFDFITKEQKTVDVKAGFRDIHKRLLVNVEQFDNIPKDFYVGIKLNGVDLDSEEKIIDLHSITEAIVYGYAEYTYMLKRARCQDFGEGLAKYLGYSQLMGIDKLIDMFDNSSE